MARWRLRDSKEGWVRLDPEPAEAGQPAIVVHRYDNTKIDSFEPWDPCFRQHDEHGNGIVNSRRDVDRMLAAHPGCIWDR